jgi:hypothetical protein
VHRGLYVTGDVGVSVQASGTRDWHDPQSCGPAAARAVFGACCACGLAVYADAAAAIFARRGDDVRKCSFLKKRTKKAFIYWSRNPFRGGPRIQVAKVFWFIFQKRTLLLRLTPS